MGGLGGLIGTDAREFRIHCGSSTYAKIPVTQCFSAGETVWHEQADRHARQRRRHPVMATGSITLDHVAAHTAVLAVSKRPPGQGGDRASGWDLTGACPAPRRRAAVHPFRAMLHAEIECDHRAKRVLRITRGCGRPSVKGALQRSPRRLPQPGRPST
jgi:hypothetical protein